MGLLQPDNFPAGKQTPISIEPDKLETGGVWRISCEFY